MVPAVQRAACPPVRPETRAGLRRVLPAHSSFDRCIHNAGIGQHETHLLAIAPEEQIGVRDDLILILRGVGAGTVWVDRIGTGIGHDFEGYVARVREAR